ncbi:GRAM domain-containing protein 2A-like isoform X2 [Anneissia japonica]|uniref:GRAM domain-containing protein 2A-like isoform X2 n=1 Tax=Anneissia japonica TaxID=1529436 RepID=UPI0014257F74|nr:GRAM domain-containing protein 2A-like isoform X2 [Anneissia japonica]
MEGNRKLRCIRRWTTRNHRRRHTNPICHTQSNACASYPSASQPGGVTGAFRQGLPDRSNNNEEAAKDCDSNTSAVREQFQYADPGESGDADHMLMSNTQGYLKGKKPPDARSKSFSNSVSEVFTEAFAKIEEMGQEARNKQFHKHFPNIPADEIVINSYSCAYVKDILLQGRLYVSKNWLCFHSNIFGFETHVSVTIGEVKDLTRERTALIVPNAIGIQTENEKFVFGSLLSRAATYKLITRILQEYREGEGLEGVPSASRESSVIDSELDTPDSETNFEGKDGCYPKEEEETSFTVESNSNAINTTNESQRNPAIGVPSKSSFGHRMKEMICAISVFKSILRTGSSLRNVPHSQLFLVVTYLLIVLLFISGLLLSFKVWRLNPPSDQNNPTLNVNDQNLHGFLRNHEKHSKTIQSIRLLLEEHLKSLAKIQDSLQYLHKTATSQSETETAEAKVKPESDEL